jgi:3-deoxy-D-manno-octulosonic acid kinase
VTRRFVNEAGARRPAAGAPAVKPWRHLAADPVLAAFAVLEDPAARVLIRRGYEGRAVDLGLSGGVVRPVAWATGGREPHAIVVLATGERVLIRRYQRGGLLRRLNRGTYLVGNRAIREARVTELARAGGVRAPIVVAAIERPRTLGYTAVLATLWIPLAAELASWLRAAPEEARSGGLFRVGGQLGRMHAAAIAHPDLNLRNFLVVEPPGSPQPEVHVIDFDRARTYAGGVPATRRRRDLLRLRRSAAKLAIPLSAGDWLALREGYGPAWPFPGSLG